MGAVDAAAVRAFVERSRRPVEHQKQVYWAAQHREQSYQRTLAVSHALYEHVRRIRPDFPTERDRADDLAHHIAFKQLLDRISNALAVR
ncbi:MAG: hypothetical protein IPK82_29335 [Polyangiaceae bacterium]|nr:hypothetical protein [Polyangiaceae bacterium]